MFIKLHGVIDNNRVIVNVNHIEAIQEIKMGSKYYKFHTESGAKTVIGISGEPLLIKESITQIEHLLQKTGNV